MENIIEKVTNEAENINPGEVKDIVANDTEKAKGVERFFSFKSAQLNAYSKQIAELGEKVASANVELARILGKVSDEGCYKLDGFKSVAEYAEKTFGIKRSNAYQLAKVGSRFINASSDTAKKVSAMLPVSCLAEIAGMTDEEIQTGIDNGVIETKSTQKDLREVAKGVKESKDTKTTVEKTRAIKATIVHVNSIISRDFMGTLSVFVEEVLKTDYVFKECVSKSVFKDKEKEVVLIYSSTGDFAKLELRKPANVTFNPKPLNQYKPEEILAAYEALMRVQGNAEEEEEEEEEG